MGRCECSAREAEQAKGQERNRHPLKATRPKTASGRYHNTTKTKFLSKLEQAGGRKTRHRIAGLSTGIVVRSRYIRVAGERIPNRRDADHQRILGEEPLRKLEVFRMELIPKWTAKVW